MMRKIIFFLLLIVGGYVVVFAQTPQFSIFESLERRPKKGQGGVVIHQSESIKRLVGTRIDSENVDSTNGKTFIKTMGYRIHVFSGNNQRTSKEETQNLRTKIKELYPNIESYIIYEAPFWRLYFGDFLMFEEAYNMQRELRKIFAQRKNEIYIITDEIRLMLD